METTVVGPQRVDFDEVSALQKLAFTRVIDPDVDPDTQSPAVYRWKYSPPAGPGRSAMIRENGRLVSMNSMFPLEIISEGRTLSGWQSCDTATHPECRGRGHFLRCLEALKNTLGPGEIFFGFPNANSAPGFSKFGWRSRGIVTTWIRPVSSGRSREGSIENGITEIETFVSDAEQAKIRHKTFLRKSAPYLNWRYCARPFVRYSKFAYAEHEKNLGFVVLRKARVKGRDVALVMELAGADSEVNRKLLRFAGSWARANRLWPLITLNRGIGWATSLSSGFFPVPSWILPKKQVLMGSAIGTEASKAFDHDWNVQLGDWDGF